MSGLSAKAKPFVFNPSASSFNPTASSFQPAAPPPAAAPTPIAEKPVDTFDLTTDTHPMTAPTAGSSDDWEDLAEEKSQSTIPIPVPNASSSSSTVTSSSSPPPPHSPSPTASSSSSSPPAPLSPPPPTSSLPSDLSSPIAALALDAEESKILADAAVEEEAEEEVKKVKKLDTDRVAHDEREHINIVFIGHVDAGKSTISGQILSVSSTHGEEVTPLLAPAAGRCGCWWLDGCCAAVLVSCSGRLRGQSEEDD